MMKTRRLLAVLTLVSAAWCRTPILADSDSPLRVTVATSTKGMVVSDTLESSRVGRDILAAGGNAVDAAVATALAMAVTWPEAGNIGGGGFMMIAPPGEPVVCVDYREMAPAAATQDLFVRNPDRYHPQAAGVPGTVRGLFLAHKTYGRLPWRRLVEPAVALARNGFTVDEHLAASLNRVLALSLVQDNQRYAELRRVYGRSDGRTWRAGDALTLPDLAATLARIAERGADAFYRGETARRIVAEMQRGDGLISAEDLAGYKAKIRTPVSALIQGYEVFGPPPPSSGGTTVLMILRMLEYRGLPRDPERYWNAQQIHLMVEAMKRAFRERAAHLGDPDFVAIPQELYDADFLKRKALSIDLQRATPSEALAGDLPISDTPYEGRHTTHFSIVDQAGMAVSNTYTLEQSYGCRIVVPGAGFLLNNEMGDFNWYPGYTDRTGRIGSEANLIEPGKRMLSSTSPTIVRKNGEVVLLTGSPGGRTIINTVSCILVQTLFFKRSLAEAVDGPRFHHQWLPDVIRFEESNQPQWRDVILALESKGHTIEKTLRRTGRQGSAHSISVDPASGVLTGVADWRRGGEALGVP